MIAAVALGLSGAVSAGLLIAASPGRDAIDVVVAAQDVVAGTTLGRDSLTLTRVNLAGRADSLFTVRDEARLTGLRATHDLAAGQLIQRSDVTEPSVSADERVVFVPVKDVPPAAPGSRVDLLVITGSSDHPTVQPFALGVEVRSVASGGLVVVVPAGKAAAFVYAGSVLQLAAVMVEPGSGQAGEVPVSTDQQAIDVASAP